MRFGEGGCFGTWRAWKAELCLRGGVRIRSLLMRMMRRICLPLGNILSFIYSKDASEPSRSRQTSTTSLPRSHLFSAQDISPRRAGAYSHGEASLTSDIRHIQYFQLLQPSHCNASTRCLSIDHEIQPSNIAACHRGIQHASSFWPRNLSTALRSKNPNFEDFSRIVMPILVHRLFDKRQTPVLHK